MTATTPTDNANEVHALMARADYSAALRAAASAAIDARAIVLFTDPAAATKLWNDGQALFAQANAEDAASHTVARAMQPEGHALKELTRLLKGATGTHRDLLLAMRDGQPIPETPADDEGDRL
ncbi:hypothetical protein [Deinococcus sp. 6GRE01]|uniref:hypothetical protein n=1 Tax=Deinococcus sp. 6GRE01 TaxID=2745873 RepID=UPI001E2CAF77|nr:hypothetical protein [Deinococcus sp. 6GRE01]MCD0155993.1 hypothetical protein [Deinococcus sp. 6GRE01]